MDSLNRIAARDPAPKFYAACKLTQGFEPDRKLIKNFQKIDKMYNTAREDDKVIFFSKKKC